MASKFHGKKKGLDKAVMQQIVTWYTPHMIASFALTLYENTDMSVENIRDICIACDELWHRALREGWDIKQNCLELTGIDVRSFKDSGNIDYGKENADAAGNDEGNS